MAYALQTASLEDGSTIAYGSDFSPNVPKFRRCITTLRAVTRSYSKHKNPARITTCRENIV
nr:MAG TPA: hypothetical protein [Microviridae sp.]